MDRRSNYCLTLNMFKLCKLFIVKSKIEGHIMAQNTEFGDCVIKSMYQPFCNIFSLSCQNIYSTAKYSTNDQQQQNIPSIFILNLFNSRIRGYILKEFIVLTYLLFYSKQALKPTQHHKLRVLQDSQL